MTFPGGVRMCRLDELVDWASQRYRYVKKHYDAFDETKVDGNTLIYCFGTLEGESLSGSVFSDVRFIDRFEFLGDKIADQRVWNDLGDVLRGG